MKQTHLVFSDLVTLDSRCTFQLCGTFQSPAVVRLLLLAQEYHRRTVVQYFSKPCFKSTFLGPELTTRTRQQCPLNWPTLVFGVLQLFREEFGRIRKMPRVRNKQKSVQGWIFVPVANSNFRLHLREPLKTKSPTRLLNFL